MLRLISYFAIFGLIAAQPRKDSLKIFGGHKTKISKHPWQVSVLIEEQFGCGGFLISTSWAVTAAHCILNPEKLELSIRAGSDETTNGGQIVKVKKTIIHADYSRNGTVFINDIGLLQFAKPVTINKARAILLPNNNETVVAGSLLNIAGWGMNSSYAYPVQLMEVIVNVTDHLECTDIYQNVDSSITNDMFCAGVDGIGFCYRDYGGPAVDMDRTVVVGIISGGVKCAQQYPGVYVQLSNYRDWIHQNTGI